MRRARIIEDWSRFNRAVLEVADGDTPPIPRRNPAPPQPKRETAERAAEPGDDTDTYGIIARHHWRQRA